MSENKDNKLTLINEKTANDYLTHTQKKSGLKKCFVCDRIFVKRNGQEKEDNTWKEKEN